MSEIQPNIAAAQIHNTTFNSLPVEIIKEIFRDISCPDLLDMRSVCSFWSTIIQDILKIQEIQVTAERYSDAINVIRINKNVARAFRMFQAPTRIQDLICEEIIGNQIWSDIFRLKEINYFAVFNKLNSTDDRRVELQFRGKTLWKTIIAMTGINYSVKFLKRRRFKNQEKVKSIMAKYRWYTFSAKSNYSSFDGMAVLYPDSRTFAILYGLDTGFAEHFEYNYRVDYRYNSGLFFYNQPDWDL